jgi:ABC-2 type transport system ATP-binding protein
MSEMALTADQLVVIGRGRLISTGSVDDFIAKSSGQFIRVRSPRSEDLNALIAQHGGNVTQESDGALAVTGLSASAIGELSGRSGIFLHELSPQAASLEEAFMELTRDSVEFHGSVDLARMATATSSSASAQESGN